MRILVIDVGGTHIKVAGSWDRITHRIPSGPTMTAADAVQAVLALTKDWDYEAVSLGYPGPVKDNRPYREPINIAGGWISFDFQKAFGKPVKVINDAAMQALGSYAGGRMLFLGLGTGLGNAIVEDWHVEPLELAHLPYRKGKSYEEYIATPASRASATRSGRSTSTRSATSSAPRCSATASCWAAATHASWCTCPTPPPGVRTRTPSRVACGCGSGRPSPRRLNSPTARARRSSTMPMWWRRGAQQPHRGRKRRSAR